MADDRRMLLPRSFALGLFAYVRQAALSLHRAPENYREAMLQYYAEQSIPLPARVLAELDRFSHGVDRTVAGELLGILLRRWVSLNADDFEKARNSLQAFDHLLIADTLAPKAQRIDVRLGLSSAEEQLRGRLRLRSGSDANRVEHLNASPTLRLQPLTQISGPSWPGQD